MGNTHDHEHEHSHHHIPECGYASRASQLGDEPCGVFDTEEMEALRQQDDSDSLKKLGGMLIQQYRYREAAEVLEKALSLEPESPSLHLRLAGIYLTLFRHDEAMAHYDKAEQLGAAKQAISFARGVACYFKEDYEKAASLFADCDHTDGEALASAIYWNTLSACRAGICQRMLSDFNPDMNAGHHTAYKETMMVFAGFKDPADIEFGHSELDDAIIQYGLSVYYESVRNKEKAGSILALAAGHESVWPCVACLAAWNDLKRI